MNGSEQRYNVVSRSNSNAYTCFISKGLKEDDHYGVGSIFPPPLSPFVSGLSFPSFSSLFCLLFTLPFLTPLSQPSAFPLLSFHHSAYAPVLPPRCDKDGSCEITLIPWNAFTWASIKKTKINNQFCSGNEEGIFKLQVLHRGPIGEIREREKERESERERILQTLQVITEYPYICVVTRLIKKWIYKKIFYIM